MYVLSYSIAYEYLKIYCIVQYYSSYTIYQHNTAWPLAEVCLECSDHNTCLSERLKLLWCICDEGIYYVVLGGITVLM